MKNYNPDKAFTELVEKHESLSHVKTKTTIRGTLEYMNENEDLIWWYPWDLISKYTKSGRYLSHRAPARASDLAKFYPELVEGRKIGRYKLFRVRRENQEEVDKAINSPMPAIPTERGELTLD